MVASNSIRIIRRADEARIPAKNAHEPERLKPGPLKALARLVRKPWDNELAFGLQQFAERHEAVPLGASATIPEPLAEFWSEDRGPDARAASALFLENCAFLPRLPILATWHIMSRAECDRHERLVAEVPVLEKASAFHNLAHRLIIEPYSESFFHVFNDLFLRRAGDDHPAARIFAAALQSPPESKKRFSAGLIFLALDLSRKGRTRTPIYSHRGHKPETIAAWAQARLDAALRFKTKNLPPSEPAPVWKGTRCSAENSDPETSQPHKENSDASNTEIEIARDDPQHPRSFPSGH